MKFRINCMLVALCIMGLATTGFTMDIASEERLTDVKIHNRADVERLADLGLDIVEVTKDKVTIVAGSEELRQLETAGFSVTPMMTFAEVTRSALGDLGRAAADAGLYHTYDEATAELKRLAKEYPKLAKLEKIGQSFEKRPVYGLRISAATKKVPKLLLVGLHHSREWMSVEVPLYAAKQLLAEYGNVEKITSLLQNREVFVVPVMNPDGLNYSQTASSYWRKNRNDNNGNKYKGVDPNRNYGYQWGTVGASDYPGSDTYHGTAAFSEPCNQNIKRLAEKEKFTASISFHSYSQLVLYPFGYGYDIPCADTGLLSKLAGEMAKFNRYRPQNSADLYPAMGDSDDWLYGTMGCLAFTFELDRSFVPSESQIATTTKLNYPAIVHLLDAIGTSHASNHPEHVSAVRFRAGQLAYLTGVADYLRRNGREAKYLDGILNQMDATRQDLIKDLTPVNDPDGTIFRDLVAVAGNQNDTERMGLVPVLTDLKSLYLQELTAGRTPAIYSRRIEALDALIPVE